MIPRILGAIMIIGSIGGFFLANSPIISAMFGGTMGETLSYYANNIFWILPAGFFLLTWGKVDPLIAIIPVVVAMAILHLLLLGVPRVPWLS